MTKNNPSDIFRFRDRKMSDKIILKLKSMKLNMRLMHVCGTHQDTLIRYGLDSLLKETGVEIRQGPGCPVCVTTQREIEECLTLAKTGKILTVFGDMMKVPGMSGSLSDLHTRGADIRIVYSIEDAVNIARKDKNDVIFMAIGFETTSPSTATTILSEPPENFSILCCHRTVPPALKAILEMGEIKLDGLIEPGHVSTIIGAKPYEFLSQQYKIPQVIAGFEPLDLLMGVYILARQIDKGTPKVEIEYARVVKYEGNKIALKMLDDVFQPCDVAWRGFPVIPGSGMVLKNKFGRYDARKRFEDDLKHLEKIKFKESKGCKCGDVLRGVIYSDECNLFRKVCTPTNPVGPCMVSSEGSCNILYRYGKTN